MRNTLSILILFLVGITLHSCSSYIVAIDSNPKEADVNVVNNDGQKIYAGRTPVKITSKFIPEGDYTIILSKPGYEDNRTFRGNLKKDKIKNLNLGTRTLKKIEPKAKRI